MLQRGTLTLWTCSKFQNDGFGDPTAFFADVQRCLLPSRCDQLLILDCSYAALALPEEQTGKQKSELLAACGPSSRCPAPSLLHSFTARLQKSLKKLLKKFPEGFSTSRLYHDLYNTTPVSAFPRNIEKPLLFDVAQKDLGKVWLRHQKPSSFAKKSARGVSIKLIFGVVVEPDLAVMNEIARSLQYVPNVDYIKFEGLFNPAETLIDFVRLIMTLQKVTRIWMKKMRVKQSLSA